MRIAGFIEHPGMKITIFHYQNRYSLKFENPYFEQTFKLPEDLFPTVDSVRDLVTGAFLQEVENRFIDMSSQMHSILHKPEESEDPEPWPEII
jgi:hypothetical protein